MKLRPYDFVNTRDLLLIKCRYRTQAMSTEEKHRFWCCRMTCSTSKYVFLPIGLMALVLAKPQAKRYFRTKFHTILRK